MDQSLDNKDLKTKLILILKTNKIKISIIILIIFISFFHIYLLKSQL